MSTSLTVVVEKPRGRKKQPEGQSLYVLPHVVHGLDALAAQLDLAPFSSFVREASKYHMLQLAGLRRDCCGN